MWVASLQDLALRWVHQPQITQVAPMSRLAVQVQAVLAEAYRPAFVPLELPDIYVQPRLGNLRIPRVPLTPPLPLRKRLVLLIPQKGFQGGPVQEFLQILLGHQQTQLIKMELEAMRIHPILQPIQPEEVALHQEPILGHLHHQLHPVDYHQEPEVA